MISHGFTVELPQLGVELLPDLVARVVPRPAEVESQTGEGIRALVSEEGGDPACQSPAPAGFISATAAASSAAEVGRVQGTAIATSRIRNGTCFRCGERYLALKKARRMDTRWSGEEKYRTLLVVCQAANSQRDLSSVLAALAGALEGLVPVDLIGVVTHTPETVRARAIYFRSLDGVPAKAKRPTCGGSRKRPAPRGTSGSTPPSCATPWSATARRWSSTTSGPTRVPKGPA